MTATEQAKAYLGPLPAPILEFKAQRIMREMIDEIESLHADRTALLDQWNAIVQASGSRTHGGAVGVVAETRRENAQLRELLRRALVVIERADVQTCLEVEIRKALDAT